MIPDQIKTGIERQCEALKLTETQRSRYLKSVEQDYKNARNRSISGQQQAIALTGIDIAFLFASGLMTPVILGDDPDEWKWQITEAGMKFKA